MLLEMYLVFSEALKISGVVQKNIKVLEFFFLSLENWESK